MAAPTKQSAFISIMGYLPAILAGLTAAFQIKEDIGHAGAAKLVNDSLAAAAGVTGLIPNDHVQAISQIVTTIAPSVEAALSAATPKA